MSLFIYLIAFLEGFTTLSIEIIAIRNFTPIIGTNSISTSIILGIILLALSYGYYRGGKNTKNIDNINTKIILNLTIASAYYYFISFVFDERLVWYLLETTNSYFLSILISSFLLFFVPIFFASQTIPLLSEVLKGENTGEKIGKLLFFSTIGSFFGSVGTSSFLFATIGVEKSGVFNSLILSVIAVVLCIKTYKKFRFSIALAFLMLFISLFSLFTNKINPFLVYEKANSYHNIMIAEDYSNRYFLQNMGYSSGIVKDTKESFFRYIIEIKDKLISKKYENIAVVGAAGFTLPNELSKYEHVESIDVIDVDSSLKEISEKYFLQEELSDKINFIVEPCRYFLNNAIKEGKKYDAIIIDIYVGNSLPPQTLTLEFYEGLKQISPNIYINLITDRALESDFSKNIFATIKEAFGEVYYKDVNVTDNGYKTNFVVTNLEYPGYSRYISDSEAKIYTDDKNSIELDLFEILN